MIQLPAYLNSFRTKVDRSGSISVGTQELTDTQVLELFNLQGSFGWLCFAENQQDIEIPSEKAEDASKTPAQRLRGVFYVLWQQRGSKGDFEGFYREKMEVIIKQVKDKLEQHER